MHRALTRWMGALALAAGSTLAVAQDADPTTVVNAGLQVAQLIDAGHADQVWDGASAVAKKLVARPEFVQSVGASRQPLGAVQSRSWITVARHDSSGSPQLPAGSYVNVEYQTSFAGGRTATELISFRLDDDKTWRVTGYFLR